VGVQRESLRDRRAGQPDERMRSVLRRSVKFLILGMSGPGRRRGRRRPAVRVLAGDDERDPGARDQRG
jgi:hypothetical protein